MPSHNILSTLCPFSARIRSDTIHSVCVPVLTFVFSVGIILFLIFFSGTRKGTETETHSQIYLPSSILPCLSFCVSLPPAPAGAPEQATAGGGAGTDGLVTGVRGRVVASAASVVI